MKNLTNYYIQLYTCDTRTIPSNMDILPVPSPFNAEESKVLFPLDPSTGQVRDLLSQILNAESPLKRDSLMSKLETLPVTSPALKGVDDSIKVQLLKPRSVQTLSEMAQYADFVKSALDQLNVEPPKPEPEPEPEPVPEPEPF